MNTNPHRRISETLLELEEELCRITGFKGNPCHDNPHIAFFQLSYGITLLESMHHTSEEHRNKIIDLHSRYINTSFNMFGNYYGNDEKI